MKKSIYWFLFPLLFGFSCGSGAGSDSRGGESMMTSMSAEEQLEPKEADGSSMMDEAPVERRIIRTGDMRMQVESVEKSTDEVRALVEKHNGYISEMGLTNSNYEINNNMVIRVPAEQFELLMDALEEIGVFTNYRRISSQDVTAEYIDVETRLANKREVRDRYIDILRNQAKRVEDVLAAEEKIRGIQEEIEAQEARLKYLQNQVAFSTVHLDIYQRVEVRRQPDVYHVSFIDRLLASLGKGWVLLTDLFLFLISIWPLLILLTLILWKRRWLLGKLRK